MGRGAGKNRTKHAMTARANNDEPQDAFDFIILAANDVVDNSDEPMWWSPNDAQMDIAAQLARQHDLDFAVALRLTKERFLDFAEQYPSIYREELEQAGFHRWMKWLYPTKSLLRTPEQTVPGLNAAGRTIAEALQNGDRIAVYCDYDPDGTCAGEAFRQAVLPYTGTPCTACSNRGGHPGEQSCTVCGNLGYVGGVDIAGQDTGAHRLLYGYADAQQGFGLTTEFVEQAHAAGAKVLVTVDCGSTQVEQAALAKELGMKVVVVDHHGLDDNESLDNPVNPADHHINPLLYTDEKGRPSSLNTGAQLAWKLGVATQAAMEGKPRPEYAGQALYLSGFGCNADMGDVGLHEHRACFWYALDKGYEPPLGLQMLADKLGNDVHGWHNIVYTQAAANLPKRTPLVSADKVGFLLSNPNAEELGPVVNEIVAAYEEAKPVRKEMVRQAREQIGLTEDNKIHGQGDETRVVHAVLDVDRNYAGYTGPAASNIATAADRPALVFAYRQTMPGEDETLKWSLRQANSKSQFKVGEMRDAETEAGAALAAASTVRKQDESGEWADRPSYGGHEEVLSGSCNPDKIDDVVEAVKIWAAGKKAAWDRPPSKAMYEAYPSERLVAPERIENIEQVARRFSPNGRTLQRSSDGSDRKMRISGVTVSVVGEIDGWQPAEDNPDNYKEATLTLGNGLQRKVLAKNDWEPPKGKAEIVVEFGGAEPYYIRTYHQPKDPDKLQTTPADREALLKHYRLLEYSRDEELLKARDKELKHVVLAAEG